MDALQNFISLLDGKLLIAGIMMVTILTVVVALGGFSIKAIKRRQTAIKVQLPSVDELSETGKIRIAPQFEQKDMNIDLIEKDEVIAPEIKRNDDDIFLSVLSLAVGKSMLEEKINMNVAMPVVGDLDFEEIENERRAKQAQKQKEALDKLKMLAHADNNDSEEDMLMSSLSN